MRPLFYDWELAVPPEYCAYNTGCNSAAVCVVSVSVSGGALCVLALKQRGGKRQAVPRQCTAPMLACCAAREPPAARSLLRVLVLMTAAPQPEKRAAAGEAALRTPLEHAHGACGGGLCGGVARRRHARSSLLLLLPLRGPNTTDPLAATRLLSLPDPRPASFTG